MCENDILSVGAMDDIRARFHLQVPEDIAIVGFDNYEFSVRSGNLQANFQTFAGTIFSEAQERSLGIRHTAIHNSMPGAARRLNCVLMTSADYNRYVSPRTGPLRRASNRWPS